MHTYIYSYAHIHSNRALGIRYLLITRNGQLVGILKKKDILEHIEMYRKGLREDPAFPGAPGGS